MASCTSLRFFSVSPPRHLKTRNPNSRPHLLSLSSPISFQRLTSPRIPKSNFQEPGPTLPATSPAASAAEDTTALPAALRDIVALFQSVPDPKARYKQLLAYGAKLPPMDPVHKTEQNRVHGCVSRVWVHAAPHGPGGEAVRFEADSDSALTKGLAALLVLGLSGAPARDVARAPPDFIELLGIRQSLTPSRNSGLLNMFKLMQRKALEISEAKDSILEENSVVSEIKSSVLEDKSGQNLENSAKDSVLERNPAVNGAHNAQRHAILVEKENLGHAENLAVNGARDANQHSVSVQEESLVGGRKERIRERLELELSPVKLEIEDISHLHKGHAGVAGSNGETHFNVRVVSEAFEGKSLLKRHRLVYDLLQEELKSGLHALSIDAKTPSEA